MLQMAHVGIYVQDLEATTAFYKNVFGMHVLCENVIQEDDLIADLLCGEGTAVRITKLITEKGKVSGSGDMLELLQVAKKPFGVSHGAVCSAGRAHCCFWVKGMRSLIARIVAHGGTQCTKIHIMDNGNLCCFVQDNERNWIELIEHRQ